MDKRRDMTVGSEWKELLLFSLPIMAGQFLQQLYNTVDSIVVSSYGGATREICNAMFAAVGSGLTETGTEIVLIKARVFTAGTGVMKLKIILGIAGIQQKLQLTGFQTGNPVVEFAAGRFPGALRF